MNFSALFDSIAMRYYRHLQRNVFTGLLLRSRMIDRMEAKNPTDLYFPLIRTHRISIPFFQVFLTLS